MPPHHHHHHGRRGGGYPYPFPIQYDSGPREIFVVDDTPKETCNPTPPLKPLPGTYRKPNGQYCWPTPRATGDAEVSTTTAMIWNVGGLAAVGYIIYKLFSGQRSR